MLRKALGLTIIGRHSPTTGSPLGSKSSSRVSSAGKVRKPDIFTTNSSSNNSTNNNTADVPTTIRRINYDVSDSEDEEDSVLKKGFNWKMFSSVMSSATNSPSGSEKIKHNKID